MAKAKAKPAEKSEAEEAPEEKAEVAEVKKAVWPPRPVKQPTT